MPSNIVFRLLYRGYRMGTALWSKVRRRFTDAGLAVLAAFFLTAIMAIDTEHNVDYQAFPLLGVLLFLAISFAGSFRGRFTARRVLPRFGTVGQPLRYRVEVSNLARGTQGGLSVLEDVADTVPSYAQWIAAQFQDLKHMRSFRFEQRHRLTPFRVVESKETALPAIPGQGQGDAQMELLPLRRGLLRLKGLIIARADPIGLFRAFIRVPLPQSVLILPRRYRLPPIALPGSFKYQEGGVAMASNVGQSDEFVSLREYRHGDPVRHIHWRTWARVGRPVVKEFEDEFFVRHALVLDTFTDYEHSEVFEEAVSVAASFACTITTQESLLDLLFVGAKSYCFTAGRGLAHSDQMLEILASVTTSTEQSFSALESLVLDHASGVSGCIAVLLAWDEARQEFVRKLRMLGLPVMVFVVVPQGSRALSAGPLQDEPDRFHVLQVGDIERGLADVT